MPKTSNVLSFEHGRRKKMARAASRKRIANRKSILKGPSREAMEKLAKSMPNKGGFASAIAQKVGKSAMKLYGPLSIASAILEVDKMGNAELSPEMEKKKKEYNKNYKKN